MFSRFCTTTAVGLCMISGPAFADWSTNLITLGATSQGDTGEVECVANGPIAPIWGTGTYTSDSSVCTAALHFGWITHGEGGVVSFRTVQGLETYEASDQNGVSSLTYGSWSTSFQLTGATPLQDGSAVATTPITWDDNPDNLGVGEAEGEVFSYVCPADTLGGGAVWGTDVYTSDSSICTAARHRGLVTLEAGGPVTILILASQPIYIGTDRNGVASADYPAWSRSYVFQ